MFEDLIKEMERMDGQSVSIPINSDEHGYIDKQCPSDECEFLFKVNEEDWAEIFKDEAVWCPLCRHEAPADQWFTIEQVEHAEKEALALMGQEGQVLFLASVKVEEQPPITPTGNWRRETKGGKYHIGSLKKEVSAATVLAHSLDEKGLIN